MKASSFNPLLEENIQDLTVPSYKVFQTIVAARAGNAVGAESQVCYIEEKEAFYNYCSNCGLPDDGDLVLTTADGGTSRWEMIQKVSRTQGDTGWIDRDGLTVTKLNSTTLRMTLTSNGYYAVNSTRVTLAAGNYDISFTGTARTIAVYLTAAGTLAQSNDVPGALFTSTPVAVVYWTGTAIGGIQTEFHGIRDTVWHAWAHKYLGTQYTSGLAITTNTQPDTNTDPGADDTVQYLWLTTGTIHDEDTAVTIGTGNWLQTLGSGLTSATAAVIPFFYYNGVAVVGAAANANREPFLFTGANGYPQRENNGVLTSGTNGEYMVYHYFAAPFIDGYSVFARPHNNTTAFTTLLAAQAARPSSLVWSAIGEFKHIYSVIYRCGNWGNTPTHNCKIVSVQDFRLVSSGPASGNSASSHGALSGLADAGAHPASAIAPDTTNFNSELSSAESSVQLALDRLDDYDSLLDWATGKTYRVGNVVKFTTEGFIGEWRATTAHTASAAVTTDINLGYWELVASSEGVRELVNAASHGFVAGDVLYSNAGTYAKAKADLAATAEVVGIVTGATTNYFVLAKTGKVTKTAWGLTAGAVYFLSAATAGAITTTEPSVVGQISKPVLVATSTTEANFVNMRGSTVGGANLRTTIALANNTATTVQNVSAYTAGSIEGEVYINATTPVRFWVRVPFVKNGAGTDYEVGANELGSLPSGFTFSITSGGLLQANMPSISGFVSAQITFALNAPAVGTTLPLQIDSNLITFREPTMFRNVLINGNMSIDQRNAAAAQTFTAGAALAYSVDRWYGYCTGANVTGQKVAGTLSQFMYQFTGAASVTAIGFAQRIEAANSWHLANGNATLAVDLANSLLTTVTWTAYYANTADTFGTLASPTRTQISTGTFTVTSTMTRYSTTIAIPAAATTGIEIVFTVGAQTSGTWKIGRVQLEQGTVATPFEFRPYGTELALCQRYYEKSFRQSVVPANLTSTNGAQFTAIFMNATFTFIGRVYFNTPKRIPTYAVTFYSFASGGTGKWEKYGGTAYTVTTDTPTESSFGVYTGENTVASSFIYGHWTADAEL